MSAYYLLSKFFNVKAPGNRLFLHKVVVLVSLDDWFEADEQSNRLLVCSGKCYSLYQKFLLITNDPTEQRLDTSSSNNSFKVLVPMSVLLLIYYFL